MNKDAKFSMGAKPSGGNTSRAGGGRREAGSRAASFSTESRQNHKAMQHLIGCCLLGSSERNSDHSGPVGRI
jgi:hypothetical protein